MWQTGPLVCQFVKRVIRLVIYDCLQPLHAAKDLDLEDQ